MRTDSPPYYLKKEKPLSSRALNVFTRLFSFNKKEKQKPFIKNIVIQEALLDKILPDLIDSLIYSGAITILALMISSIFENGTFKVADIFFAFVFPFSTWAFNKSDRKSNLSILYPVLFILMYQRLTSLLAIQDSLIYLIIWLISFMFFYIRTEKINQYFKESIPQYLTIENIREVDFKFIIKYLDLNYENTRKLINIIHYNSRFDWLEETLQKNKLDNYETNELLFWKCIPFIWISPDKAFNLLEKYNLIHFDTELNYEELRNHLVVISNCIKWNGNEVAEKLVRRLLTQLSDTSSLERALNEALTEESQDWDDIRPIIRKEELELNLSNLNPTNKPKVLKI